MILCSPCKHTHANIARSCVNFTIYSTKNQHKIALTGKRREIFLQCVLSTRLLANEHSEFENAILSL